MSQPLYVIKHDGQGSGGFLCPPGHPNHEYAVYGYWGGRRKTDPDLIASLDYLIEDECKDVPPDVKIRARQIMNSATLIMSEAWVRMVYGYFRNCYSPDGADRNASHTLIWRSDVPATFPPEHHLGFLTIREYFPDAEPRTDLIADPGKGYGSYPCVRCGEKVQYEAREDAYCVVTAVSRSRQPDCEAGGRHEI